MVLGFDTPLPVLKWWRATTLGKTIYNLYTLVEPTVTRPVQDPLAVTSLENQQYMYNLYMHVTAVTKFLPVQLDLSRILQQINQFLKIRRRENQYRFCRGLCLLCQLLKLNSSLTKVVNLIRDKIGRKIFRITILDSIFIVALNHLVWRLLLN